MAHNGEDEYKQYIKHTPADDDARSLLPWMDLQVVPRRMIFIRCGVFFHFLFGKMFLFLCAKQGRDSVYHKIQERGSAAYLLL